LLLEEPLHDIDPVYARRIVDYLKSDIDATIIIATGDAATAQACDKVIWLNNGTIETEGTWQQVQSKIN